MKSNATEQLLAAFGAFFPGSGVGSYVNGEIVTSIKMFRDLMRYVGPDTEITLEVQRGRNLQSIKLKLTEQPK